MADPVTLDPAQLRQIVTALSSSKNSTWAQALSVFLSALSGLAVGVGLEAFRNHWARLRAHKERLDRELQQINGVTVGIGYNVEMMTHTVFQLLLPHFDDCQAACAEFDRLKSSDMSKLPEFARDLSARYPAVFMTAPLPHFEEFEFLDKLPFLIEKDANLVKSTGWLRQRERDLTTALAERNRLILRTSELLTASGGKINFHQLELVLQRQASISTSECVNATELFESLLSISESLESICRRYKGQRQQGKRLEPSPAVGAALNRLRPIRDRVKQAIDARTAEIR